MPAALRMSRVDTAWLRMDNDVNLMMIVGVWLLTPAITLEAVRARVADKLLKYDRFRQLAVPDAAGASWVADADFDIAQHVVDGMLPADPLADALADPLADLVTDTGAGSSSSSGAARRSLQRLCGDLAATPLDPSRPLWQFHFIADYEGGSAIVARIHHCIGDGIALISVMLSITDGGSDPPRRKRRVRPDPADSDWLSDAVIKPLTDLTTRAIGMYGGGISKSMDWLSDPQASIKGSMTGSVDGSLNMARTGFKVMNDVAALALMTDDSPTLLKGRAGRRPGGRKVVAWSEPLALEPVKTISKGLGCTVNDLLLSCVAGAIGGWLQAQGQDPTGQEIRAMVPVNLRPLDQAWQLGNRFGLAPLVLPVGIANPIERVQAVRLRMAQLKGSYQPLLAFAVLAVSGLLVKPVQDAVLGLFAKKATAVMTNVPGPPLPLRFCGATLRQTMFWVPASGDIGVGVSILSYGGFVQFGLITDHALCPDPQAIIDRFEPEFEKLLNLALMLPWAGQPLAGAPVPA